MKFKYEFLFHSVSISPDPTGKPEKKLNTSQDSKTIHEEEECATTPLPMARETQAPERTRLVVFGVAKIQKTRLLATLSGLKVHSDLRTNYFLLLIKWFLFH